MMVVTLVTSSLLPENNMYCGRRCTPSRDSEASRALTFLLPVSKFICTRLAPNDKRFHGPLLSRGLPESDFSQVNYITMHAFSPQIAKRTRLDRLLTLNGSRV